MNIQSPIEEIANFIGEKYYFRNFPKDLDDTGHLIPVDEPAPENGIRRIHGYINACRSAALIPYLAKMYLNNKKYLGDELQGQMPLLEDPDNIKLLQVAMLMRATGRWEQPGRESWIKIPDWGPGSLYAPQGVKQCEKVLRELGVDNTEMLSTFSKLVQDCESIEKGKLSLFASILSDVTQMETLRDTVRNKKIDISRFCFIRRLTGNESSEVSKSNFINLIIENMKLIKEQQGFIIADLTDKEQSLSDGQLTLDERAPQEPLEIQIALEKDKECYAKIEEAVNSRLKQISGCQPPAKRSSLGF